MSILRRANEQQETNWRLTPEDLWRWVIGVPELQNHERFGLRVRFPLALTEEERQRLMIEYPMPPDSPPGTQQSWRVSYTCGLSLGYVQRDGQYKSTRLVDFLSVCFGKQNVKGFRQWIENGGGPPRPADKDDQKAELDSIEEWLKWWEDLQVLGAISHHTAESGRTFANFGGPMPVGSLPGQRDDSYQGLGRGKLRSMIAECEAAAQLASAPAREVVAPRAQPRTYQEVFADGSEETPF